MAAARAGLWEKDGGHPSTRAGEGGEGVLCGEGGMGAYQEEGRGPGRRVVRMRLGRPRATSFQQTMTLLSGPHWPRGVSGFWHWQRHLG